MSNELTTRSATRNRVHGLITYRTPAEIREFAEFMAMGNASIPAHLRKNPTDCAAVMIQASEWGLNPFAVARQTYKIGDILSFGASLINSVCQSSTVIQGHFHYEYFGDWKKIRGKFITEKREKQNKNGGTYQTEVLVAAWKPEDEQGLGITVSATIIGDTEPTELTLMLSQVATRQSQQWIYDPEQQISYLAVKKFVNRYIPSVLSGVYTPDEAHAIVERQEKDITPSPEHSPVAAPEPQEEPKRNLRHEFTQSLEYVDSLEGLKVIGVRIKAAYDAVKLTHQDREELKKLYKKAEDRLKAESAATESAATESAAEEPTQEELIDEASKAIEQLEESISEDAKEEHAEGIEWVGVEDDE